MSHKYSINTRDLPNKWYLTVIFFIGFFAMQQLAVLGFNIGYAINPIVGFVTGLIVIAVTIWLLCQFKVVNEPIPTKSIPIKGRQYSLITLTVIATYILQLTWALSGSRMLKLSLHGQTSGNQTSIMTYFHHGIIPAVFMLILSVIVAPAIEEFIFRVLIIKPNKQAKYQSIRIISSLILFALAHVITQAGQIPWNMWCFYLGQYLVIGFALTVIYVKFRNYKLNYFTHVTWNAFSLILALV